MDGGIAALLAAALGAIGAAIGLIITKENKTSEFRQLWINELRDAIVGLSQAYQLAADRAPNSKEDKKKARLEVNKLVAEIQLRLNGNNPNKHELALKEILVKAESEVLAENANVVNLVIQLLKAGSKVLKAEWKRVKRGELKYRICVWIASSLAVMSMLISGTYLYHHFDKIVNIITN
ncbi:hypothetical protein [Pantoea sp. Fr+CA_20]|uniref:hypothetical protein n=1 Tax=Pantoea sp. Fr+CA_20 TaxID=2929506 RepID=UPI002118AC3E|nr:hypothetical protein [Pantoea sp. Fr+CA_20]